MNGHLDPHLQRIIDNASAMSKRVSRERDFNYSSEQRSADWNFGPGPSQPPQEPDSFNDFGQCP
jgi:hypothetical protein